MGTWSEDIFGNDLSCDVRDEYREWLAVGGGAETAVNKVKKEFAGPLRDGGEQWTFWIALAAAQLEAGEVTDEVREKALKGIAWCEEPNKGLESSPFGAKTLAALREKFGRQPPKSPMKRRPKVLPGNKGDVLAIKLPNSNREGVIVIGGPSGNGRGAEYGRVVLLQNLTVKAVTPESIQRALLKWRHHREVWPNGLGRSIGCYDVSGKLSARKTRVLLQDVLFPKPFERRMRDIGSIQRSADMSWVIENDLNNWQSRKWTIDPRDSESDELPPASADRPVTRHNDPL